MRNYGNFNSHRQQDERRERQRWERAQETKESMRKIIMNDLWSPDPAVLEPALAQLSDLLFYSRGNQDTEGDNQNSFFDLGGHVTVVKVMNTHLRCCPNIQHEGILVLLNASNSWPSRHSQHQANIADARAMEAILDAMSDYKNDEHIQNNGLTSLRHILFDHEGNAERFVTTLKAARLVCETMNHFWDNRIIVAEGCMVLRDLCSFEHLRRTIFNARALSVLASAVETHNYEPIQRDGQEAMRLLMSDIEY